MRSLQNCNSNAHQIISGSHHPTLLAIHLDDPELIIGSRLIKSVAHLVAVTALLNVPIAADSSPLIFLLSCPLLSALNVIAKSFDTMMLPTISVIWEQQHAQ